MTTQAVDYLTQISLLRLIAVLALVLCAHFARLPAWEVLFILGGLVWRALASLRQWPLPAGYLRTLVTVTLFLGVYASYGHINGQNPGTALLVGMAVLKLMEMRSRRDVMVTVFLMYFILLTHFLYSQEIWTIGYLFVCMVAITALLMEVNHPASPLPLRVTLRGAGQMVLWSVPMMLLLFVLFPRIPGPLWGLPADTGAENTGLAEDMSPGDIASLINSDEVAFRVLFKGAPPPMRDRYWRGPVFDAFDGRKWSANKFTHTDRAPVARLEGAPIEYQSTIEPHRGIWLFALDLPALAAIPRDAFLTSEYQLVQRRPVRARRLADLASHSRYQLQPSDLGPFLTRINTALPDGSNPRARELGQRLRAEHGADGAAIARALLQRFRRESFVYTLRPGTLGRDAIDEFLFDTQRGFCEHFAGSFTFVLRAAGIPARVVGGYMGGTQNEFGDYYVVRQSDAHAWSEIWIEGRGWVRYDPTAAVAPDRVEQGLSYALSESELPDFLARRSGALFDLRARWDWINNQWNQWVLGYGPELQQEFLSRLGLGDWTRMVLALTIIGSLLLGLVGFMTLRQYARARNEDRALALWQRAGRKLLRQGIAQRPSEGPQDFVARLELEHPEVAPAMRRVLRAYLRLRYLDAPQPALEQELARQVAGL